MDKRKEAERQLSLLERGIEEVIPRDELLAKLERSIATGIPLPKSVATVNGMLLSRLQKFCSSPVRSLLRVFLRMRHSELDTNRESAWVFTN